MNAECLLQHFERLAEAPDAIPRLRQFILDLAVRGKLVEQDPNNEPAPELLKRIQKHKAEFAKNGRAERGLTIMAFNDDVPLRIPDSWVWVSFGSIMISRDGERIPISKEERASRSKIYDYYGASGVIDKIDGYLFDKPLLLIGEDGANLINRATPIAFIARGKYWVNNHAHVLDGISEDFLRFIELHINAIDLKPYVTGTAQPKMNQAKMNSIPIALPPLAEQHRIVAKVDELMVLCDQLEAAKTEREQSRDRLVAASLHRLNFPDDTAETDTPGLPARQTDAFRDHARFVFKHLPRLTTRPEHIKQLRQTILNLAVRGRLVPQDLNDERAIKRQGFLAHGSDIVPFPIPATWRWATLKSLGRLKGGGTPSKSRPDYWNGEIPWVSPKDMKRDYITTTQLSISQEAIQQSAVSLIEPRSLLFVVQGSKASCPCKGSALEPRNLSTRRCRLLQFPHSHPASRRTTPHRRQGGRTDGTMRPDRSPAHRHRGRQPPLAGSRAARSPGGNRMSKTGDARGTGCSGGGGSSDT
jgi:type I restriction enzyme S subunit